MKRLIYILSLILLFAFSLQVKSQEEKKNKLLSELVKAPHDSTRLKILEDLIIVTRSQPQVRVYYIDQLQQEAEKQKNTFYMCTAYLYRMIVAYNGYDIAGVNYWYGVLEPIAQKNKYYDILFQGKRGVIDFLQITGEFEKEEREALKLVQDAEKVGSKIGMIVGHQSLGNVYLMTYRNKEAFEILEKAYQLSMGYGDPGVTLEILNSLIMVAEGLNDQVSWLKYIKLEEACIENSIQNSTANFAIQNTFFMLYIHYVAYYTKIGNLEKAGKYNQLAEKSFYASNESGVYEEYFLRVSGNYFYESKQYDKALAFSDTLLTFTRSYSMSAYNIALADHAKILFAMGRAEEALQNFKMAKVGNDSAQIQILNNQTEQVKNIHNVYMLELEKEKNKHYLQLTILVFLVISIFILTGFIIYTYRSRKKLEHDENEMRKMTNEVEQANQAKERFLSNISTSIGQPLDTVVEKSLLLASEQKIDDNQRLVISEVISDTSAELMQLINNILDLSRLEAGMMRFILSDVEVFSLIQDAATGISIEQKRKINIVCPQSALFWSHIDGPRLLNVFNNLFVSVLPGKELQVSIEVNKEETELVIRVYGTSLVARGLSQEQIIRNEINRMIINHFEGDYENRVDTHTPYVYFTIKGHFTPFELE